MGLENKTYYLKLNSKNQGNILFTSLLLLLAMNFLGLALLQTAQKEYQTADFKNIDSSNFYFAESCSQDSINWVKQQNRPPATMPYSINYSNINHLYLSNESVDNKTKLAGYAYNCTTEQITVKSTSGTQTNSGENISMTNGYGANGDLRPDYYYKITSNSIGPKNSNKKITTTIAVEY